MHRLTVNNNAAHVPSQLVEIGTNTTTVKCLFVFWPPQSIPQICTIWDGYMQLVSISRHKPQGPSV